MTLEVALLLLLPTVLMALSIQSKTMVSGFPTDREPEGCIQGTLDQPPPNQLLWCRITPKNVKDVLYKMKQPQFALLSLGFDRFQFEEDAFHPNLQALGITGNLFSISPGAFNGLDNLEILFLNKFLNPDNTMYKINIKQAIKDYGIKGDKYPFCINSTAPIFGAGWLTPLTNLKWLMISHSNISSFNVDEFCTLKRLQKMDLSGDRINSTEGLGITCSSLSCSPCLPNVTHLNISMNPISDFTLNISVDIPSLKLFNISYCNLSVLDFDVVTSERIEVFDASNNKIHLIMINEENLCNRPYLQKLWLQNNQLHALPRDFFINMPHLQGLDLSGNFLIAETLIRAGLNYLTELQFLDLSYNNIKKLEPALIGKMTGLLGFKCTGCSLVAIHVKTFANVTKLRHLVLNNNHLSIKETGFLTHFLSLQELDISGNSLNLINLTENLLSLRVLDVSHNKLSELPVFPGHWVNLSYLAINKNRITKIGPNQISGLRNLKFLSLAFNNIGIITDYTFANQSMLEKLVLSSNGIKTISEYGLDELPNLTDLSLDGNFLMEHPPLDYFVLTKLKFLNLSRNMIRSINFPIGFPFRGIDLSHNHISQIKYLSLNNLQDLQYMNLSYNHISKLDWRSFTTRILPRPKIYLQGNPLHVDCESEWILDTKHDKTWEQILRDQEKQYGWKHTSLYSDPTDKADPYSNEIRKLSKTGYYVKIADWDLLHGTTATGENKSFTELSSTDFVCPYVWFCSPNHCTKGCCDDVYSCHCSTPCYSDCSCYANSYNDSINSMDCSSRNMTSLPSKGPLYVRSIALDGNFLTSLNSYNLNFPHLIKLNAANSHISQLNHQAFRNLKMLQILNLEENDIEAINKQLFAHLINLEELYLQGNRIHQIDKGSFDDLLRLKVLFIHGNNLRILHFSLFERLYSLSQLSLHDNPWTCDCQSGPGFKEWLIRSEFTVNHSHIYCINKVSKDTGPDSSQYNMTDTSFTTPLPHHQPVIDIDFSTCTNRSIIEQVHHHHYIDRVSKIEVVSLCAVFAILSIFTVVVYKKRMLIRVWFYNKYGIRFHKKDNDSDDKPYDLFIAYSKADERLVLHGLLPQLEEGEMSYKVCLECRDWHPCAATTESVVASVQLSKRTIVLVSHNHLDTQWCEYSFDVAHYQVLKDKQMRLILVLTDLGLEARMTRAMKLYMKTNAFLVVGEKWFWKKLRYLLADNPRGADHVVGREFRLMNPY